MPHLDLNAKQYLVLLRSLSTARQLTEHIADLTDAKTDGEYQALFERLMESADDFGLSYPTKENEETHWSHELQEEVHDDLHAYVDAELNESISQDLAFGEHAASCQDETHENETCRGDLLNRRDAWLAKLEKQSLFEALQEKV
ncbi:hypothetical protein KBC55_01925 [Patescibacteria group bacterium]|nr:hypothetical protein [Patescibacteria group bacterium]